MVIIKKKDFEIERKGEGLEYWPQEHPKRLLEIVHEKGRGWLVLMQVTN